MNWRGILFSHYFLIVIKLNVFSVIDTIEFLEHWIEDFGENRSHKGNML